MTNRARTRTRLTPEARRAQLLSVAQQMIVDQGLQRFTMEALARAAEVSSPLVYNYFSSRETLLAELLAEEQDRYAQRLEEALSRTRSFEEIVRVFIASNYDHLAPGSILPILQSQPELAAAVAERNRTHGREVARYLVRNTAAAYGLTREQAGFVVQVSSGASVAAAEWAAATGADRERTIDDTLAYVLAGLQPFTRSGD